MHIRVNPIQFNSIQVNPIQFNSIQLNSSQFNSIHSNSIQCNAIHFNSIHFNSMQRTFVGRLAFRTYTPKSPPLWNLTWNGRKGKRSTKDGLNRRSRAQKPKRTQGRVEDVSCPPYWFWIPRARNKAKTQLTLQNVTCTTANGFWGPKPVQW